MAARDLDLPDLVVGIVQDTRDLVDAQVGSLKTELGGRVGELGTAIRSWLIAVCVAIVTATFLGLAIAATLVAIGVPAFLALWIVTALAIGALAGLVYRARYAGRAATAGAAHDLKQALEGEAA